MLLVCGMALGSTYQVAPPDTGKMSWGLFEDVKAMEQRSAAGEEVEEITAFFTSDETMTSEQAEELSDLGYSMIGAYGHFALVDAPGTLYSDPERGVHSLDFVSSAALPPVPMTYDYNTEGVVAMGADAAHRLGFAGEGAKIAVIEFGFDPENPILQQSSAQYYTVRPHPDAPGLYFTFEGEAGDTLSEHGTSCAIIAADIAPDAELYLLSVDSLVGWLDAMDFAVYQLGVDAISCSIVFLEPTCHADGSGWLNSDVESILDGSDILMFQAAGNWAAGSGSGDTFYGGEFTDGDGDFAHDFTPEAEDAWDRNGLRFHAKEGDYILILLEWDDWDSTLGQMDLDLILYYDEYEYAVGTAQGRQFQRPGKPAEQLRGPLPYTGYYSLAVVDGAAKWHDEPVCSVSFHIYLSNFVRPFEFVEHHTISGSVMEVATSHHVVSVGAVPLHEDTQEPYSSRGLTADGRPKPELCGPAGVTGTAYDFFPGTSAATPYVAAGFAVLKSALPELSGAEVYRRLLDTARCSYDEYGNRICVVDLEAAIADVGGD